MRTTYLAEIYEVWFLETNRSVLLSNLEWKNEKRKIEKKGGHQSWWSSRIRLARACVSSRIHLFVLYHIHVDANFGKIKLIFRIVRNQILQD